MNHHPPDEEYFKTNKLLHSILGTEPIKNEQIAQDVGQPIEGKSRPTKPSELAVSVLMADNVSVSDEIWPEPDEIIDKLLPVEKLELELIPQPFSVWISDEASRMPCPIDFVAAAAIVITGGVIGAGCGVRPKANDDWLEVANLWGTVIGLPGVEKKSPAIKKPLGLLSKLEAVAQIQHEQAKKEYQINSQELRFIQKKYESEMQEIINPTKPSKLKNKGADQYDENN